MQHYAHSSKSYNDPREVLRIMGKTAKEASDTFTVREWAAQLAALAGPRDYRGQLEQIYTWVVNNWRYVREPDEWVHGTARSLLAHVMGIKYNAPNQDPRHVKVLNLASKIKGWGDCDDVAMLVAAAARAIGMRPFFRVTHKNGAHVAAYVKTPTGEWVSVDPVGHPYKVFGWKHKGDRSELFDLEGRKVDESEESGMSTQFSGVDAVPRAQCARPHLCMVYPGDGGGPRSLAVPFRSARMLASGAVQDGTPAVDERGRRYSYNAKRDLWLDDRLMHMPFGGMDGWFSRGRKRRQARRARRRKRIKRGLKKAVDFVREGRIRNALGRTMSNPVFSKAAGIAGSIVGVPPQATEALTKGVGRAYTASSAYGRRQQQRFKQRYGGDPLNQKTGQILNTAMRFSQMGQGGGGFGIGQGGGGLDLGKAGGLLQSVAGGDASNLLSMFSGIDDDQSEAGHCGLKVGGRMVERGHLPLILRCNPVMGAQIIAARAKATSNGRKGMSGLDDDGRYVCTQGGCTFEVAPVCNITGVPGLAMGELDVESSPTPGSWYRIKKGDTLFGITSKAYGVKPGSRRLKMARWINSARANRPMIDPGNADKFFPRGRISFRARYSSDVEAAIKGAPGNRYAVIWIPATQGDEPAPKVEITAPNAPETQAAPKKPVAVTDEPLKPAKPKESLSQGTPKTGGPSVFEPAPAPKPQLKVANDFPELFPESKNMTLDAPPPGTNLTPSPTLETPNLYPELFPESENMTLDARPLPNLSDKPEVPPEDPAPEQDPPAVNEKVAEPAEGSPAAPKEKDEFPDRELEDLEELNDRLRKNSKDYEKKLETRNFLVWGATTAAMLYLVSKTKKRRR